MDRLDDYFKAYNNIDETVDVDTFYMEAKELINPRRIDIIVKYYYIKARETGENLSLAKELYTRHIEAFSDGTFREQGNSEKDSIDKYFEVFNQLIESFKKKGFEEDLSVLPIGKHNEILDGSHRAACAIYFKEKVKVIKFEDLSVDYGFEFFRKRLLDDFYLDFIAKEYVNLDRNVYAMFVWPRIGTSENEKYIDKTLKQDGFNVLYKKKMKLDKQELWNLIFNTYKNEFWVGSPANKFKGVEDNRDLNYSEDGSLYVYILNNAEVDSLTDEKEALRRHFGVGNNSIHSFDTRDQSIELINILLDQNYDKILYENFLNTKDTNYTFIKYLKKRIRYIYRKTLNKLKHIIGKPV